MKKNIFGTIILLSLAATPLDALHIGYLYPAGGKAGTTVDIVVGGSSLGGIKGAWISGCGGGVEFVKATSIPRPPTIGGSQKSYVLRWIKGLENGKPEAPPLPKEEVVRTWRKNKNLEMLDKFSPRIRSLISYGVFTRKDPLQSSPSIASMVMVTVKIAPDAKPGKRELRLFSNSGLGDPLPFFVDNADEMLEPRYRYPDYQPEVPEFTAPVVLNGQILPGGVDSFSFSAVKKERLTFSVRARELVPFLGDGVPGHFQAVIEIFNDKGILVASADDNAFNPDPVLRFTAPATGKYTLKVRDALYRGREDFVYRVKVEKGHTRNTETPVPDKRFGEKWENHKHNRIVTVPAHRKFRIMKPGGKVVFRFKCRKGERLDITVFARRLGSPLDAGIAIKDSKGKTVSFVDDSPGARIGTILHQADPALSFVAPAKGVYTAEIRDISGSGSKQSFGYCSVVRPEPDFELYAYPSGISAGFCLPAMLRVLAVRRGGFNGRIKLSIPPDSPFEIVGASTLEPGVAQASFTVAASYNRRPLMKPVKMRLFGFASAPRIGAPPVMLRREARGADELMQAFAYTHLIPANDLLVQESWGAPNGRYLFRDIEQGRVASLHPGGRADITLWRMKHPKECEYKISLADAPVGVSIEKTEEKDGMLTVTLLAQKDAPAVSANAALLVNGSFKGRNNRKSRFRQLLPAFRIEVKR